MFSSLDHHNALSGAVRISGEHRSIDRMNEQQQFTKLRGFQRNAKQRGGQQSRRSLGKINLAGTIPYQRQRSGVDSSRASSDLPKYNTTGPSQKDQQTIIKLQKNKHYSAMAQQVTHSNVELAPASNQPQPQTMSRLKQHLPETMTRKRFKNEGLAKMRKEGKRELKLELADGTGSVGTFEKENDLPYATSNTLNEPQIIFNATRTNKNMGEEINLNVISPPKYPSTTRGLASFKVETDSLIHQMEGQNFVSNRNIGRTNKRLFDNKTATKPELRSISPTGSYKLQLNAGGTGGTKVQPKSTKSSANMMKGARPSADQLGQLSTMQRKWLLKHNKPVDFDLPELKKLRNYFEQLDSDNSGAIGLEELEQPLISLNLCHSRKEVQQLMSAIDVDGNGSIEFDEFLRLIKSAQTCKNGSKAREDSSAEGSKPSSVQRTRNDSKMTDEFSLPNLNRQRQDPMSATLRGHSRQASGNDLFDKKDKKVRTLIERQNTQRGPGKCAFGKPPLNSKVQKSPTAEKKEEKSRAIYNFFKDLTSGKLLSSKMKESNFDHMETMSFDQFCSVFRRKQILKAIMPDTSEEILEKDTKTEEMLRAYKLHIRRLKAESQLQASKAMKESLVSDSEESESLQESNPQFMTESPQKKMPKRLLPDIKPFNDFEEISKRNDPSYVLTQILKQR